MSPALPEGADRVLARARRGPLSARLEAARRRVAPGETLEVAIILTVEPGFRVESVVASGGALRPTSVQLGLAQGLTPGAMRFPEGSADPLGGERLAAYVGTVAIGFPVTAALDCLPGPAPIAARVLFQATGPEGLLPPDQLEVGAEIEVSPG